ncbi:sigma-B regulation protein RsbQ [Pseudoxanthomonas sp. GM95]|uniref:alpha/beta fold hydrolase n=1 Tax=Pseudoxanthomonas sp. GM95 TaxID=1881043 RepID=UPI0008AB98B1|nr:alpha/beta hydrolase [Pseudoxanthomonas sp. GM95]SEL57055.1 sigma-B regulation protein RsbQ [Pseudoxanthomonas sp. GM95]
MDIRLRNNVHSLGEGDLTLILAHGYGCDQNMWRLLAPELQRRFRIVLFDYMGSGGSDLSQYDAERYATLDGYADDLIAVARAAGAGPLVLVGHSVSAMVGLIADQRAPGLFAAHVMIGPSPSYINRGDYVGGFERADIDELLTTLEGNYLGWAGDMAPVIMGAPDQPELTDELRNSFCRTDPQIAARFARATFLANNLADLPRLTAPALVLQSTDDFIAPVSVGEYTSRTVANGTLRLVENIGHCPHLSAPKACAREIEAFLGSLSLPKR